MDFTNEMNRRKIAAKRGKDDLLSYRLNHKQHLASSGLHDE